MNSIILRHARFVAFAIAFPAVFPPSIPSAPAQEKQTSPATSPTKSVPELVISSGSFERGGQRIAATLRNVVDALMERYPRANMKRANRDSLLRDSLGGASLEAVRAKSLAGMLDAARRRRRARAIFSGDVMTLLVVMTALVITQRRDDVPSLPVHAIAQKDRVKIIDDEQLLALFPERSVALIGQPGTQRLIFLDAPAESRAPAPQR